MNETQMTLLSAKRPWPHWLLWLTVLLGFTWPLLHSVALRYSLLVVLLVSSIVVCRRTGTGFRLPKSLVTPAGIYLWLSAWFLSTVLIADSAMDSLSEYRSEWITGWVALTIGILIAKLADNHADRRLNRENLFGCVLLGLTLPLFVEVGQSLVIAARHFTFRGWDVSWFGRTSLSFVHNILYGLLVADALSRLNAWRPLLPLSAFSLKAAFVLSFLCTYLLNTRNGTLGVIVITLLASLIAWVQLRHRIKFRLVAVLACTLVLATGVFAKLSYDAEPRWQAFGESIRLALDTQTYRAWLDDRIALPRMSNGQPVDHSAYMRLAWFREGALATIDFPLGVGFGRDAFGQALQRKYGEGHGHSHSSMIDFALSGGIPGLLIWLVFSATLLRLGSRAYFEQKDPAGMALVLLVAGTLFRMVIDSNLRDHGLQQYLFLLGVLATLAANTIDWQTASSERSPTIKT